MAPIPEVRIRPLSEPLARKAALELNERPECIARDLAAIKQWLAKTEHITARMDDQFLIGFLRGCKYRMERVKEKLEMFYTVRTALPKVIGHRDPLEERNQEILLKFQQTIFLPKTITPDGPRIIIHRMSTSNAKLYTIEECMKVTVMVSDLHTMLDDNLIVAGAIAIIDIGSLSLDHILQLTPNVVKQLTILSQEASPLRLKEQHFVRCPAGFELGFNNIFKRLLTPKNQSRMIIHKNFDTLYSYVPRSVLPTEYGGYAGSIEDITANTNSLLKENRQFFLDDHRFCVDETKRPGKAKTTKSLFGLQGSFKSLSAD